MEESGPGVGAAAGAEVRRSALARAVECWGTPRVGIYSSGRMEGLSARVLVGADGQGSAVRKWAGFHVREDPARMLLSGLLFEEVTAAQDAATIVINPFLKQGALAFPQGNGRTRCYFGCRVDSGVRLQGEKDVSRFIEAAIKTGLPAAVFDGATPNGPLATFSGADEWTDHPYRDGVALLGDAAATSDPTWGQGLSLTMRDVRTLRDKLVADDDWDRAGHAYAEEHDRYFQVTHTMEDWLTQLFMDEG